MASQPQDELRLKITFFLKDFKELMGQGHYYIKGHFKNIEALSQLGITTRMRDTIILSISLTDYSSGPNPDTLHPGHYWVFGKQIDGVEIYIKLKIVTSKQGNENAVCISFHPSEYPLEYPFG